MDHQARCLCGNIRVTFDTDGVLWRGHCHCESCRRATASPFTTFFGVRNTAWRWSGSAPAEFASSPGVRRYFCPNCGSPVAYATDRLPDETHFYAAGLDDPAQFRPGAHYHWAEKLPWVHLTDELPRHSAFSTAGTD